MGVTKIIEAVNTKSNITRAYAYCRVSTDMSHQINSYEAQKEYYENFITEKPNHKKVVRLIYDEYLNGKGIHIIARELTESKIKSPKGNKIWNSATVYGKVIDKILISKGEVTFILKNKLECREYRKG